MAASIAKGMNAYMSHFMHEFMKRRVHRESDTLPRNVEVASYSEDCMRGLQRQALVARLLLVVEARIHGEREASSLDSTCYAAQLRVCQRCAGRIV
eukprot:483756-Pleurochrysis_carterae.AAC.5